MRSAFRDLIVTDPRRWALFLDFDGTLVDMASEPGAVRIPVGLPELLAALNRALGGALALNTGRRLATVDALLAPHRFSGAGVHGAEIRLHPHDDIRLPADQVPPALVGALRRLIGPSDGLVVEDKQVGIAVHYRKAPDAVGTLHRTLAELVRGWPGYKLRGGRMVYEIIPRAFSKATAIEFLLRHPPFLGRLPVVIGDDRGDEPAIKAARAMGGAAFTVGGEFFASGADFAGPASVRATLRSVLEALSG
ncbi:MAG: trehalose-phosphatase [Hyphomicrobiaceae bacterium]|nr:trehalose-phosphatase [Hyphomicrobiaceae bacterium]